MRRITHLQQICALAVMVLGASARGAGPPGWGTLTPGPFTVGFKSSWRLDSSRAYNRVFDDKTTYASGKSPRPILINMWYPAEPAKNLEPMPHRGYLDIRSSEPQFSKFADELIGYEQDAVRTLIRALARSRLLIVIRPSTSNNLLRNREFHIDYRGHPQIIRNDCHRGGQ
jgi:hypothetical protein